MGGAFMGFCSLGPDEDLGTESPRDYDRRNSAAEMSHDSLLRQLQRALANPDLSSAQRRDIEDQIQRLAHEVLPYSRKTGRRMWVDGEGIVEQRIDDRDVALPHGNRIADALGGKR